MQTRNQNPFLGLKPYESRDRQRLYGRDKDLFLMGDRILSGRTTLLFAGSGVGKTSFINAKIIPELEEQEYYVIYHKEWAREPLAALVNSVTAKLPPDADPSPSLIGSKSLLAHLSAFTKPVDVDSPAGKRCVIILDQFEEIFQYHSHETYFARFIEELSELINSDKCNARVLFSMREEFLGELSVFDNKIPDLFSNYYRLKSPTRAEAQEIIKLTCHFVNVPVNGDNLKTLVSDLARVMKGQLVVGDAAVAGETSLEWDIVAPPYLQIACQRLWDVQFSSKNGDEIQSRSNGDFLADYKRGHAHKMLTLFFRENLSSFNKDERALLADAFDYLVTKKGAKMAYELSFLAELMEVQESSLESILVKLSEARILRKSMGRDRSPWFELYHDMYAPIIDEWKRGYRLERTAEQRRSFKKVGATIVVVSAFVAVFAWAYVHWVYAPRGYEQSLRNAKLQDRGKYIETQRAFMSLKGTWGFENKARQLWADAWKRRALDAERQENSQEALLSWLIAAAQGSSDQEAALLSQVGPYLNSDDYQSLLASYSVESGAGSSGSGPIFSADGTSLFLSADGKTLIGATKDLRVLHWDVGSNKVRETPPLELDDTNSLRDRSQGGPPDPYSPAEAQIKAAAGGLIGGLSNGKFYVWRADLGTKLWISDSNNGPDSEGRTERGNLSYGGYGGLGPSISFTPNGQHFATVDQRGFVQVYNVSDKQTVVPSPGGSISSVATVAFSPDNQSLLVLFKDETLQVRDLKTGALRTHASRIDPSQKARSNLIPKVTFSPDGSRFLLNMGPIEQAEIWDIASGLRPPVKIEGPEASASLNFCADSKTVAVSDVVDYGESKKILIVKFLNSDTGDVFRTRTIIIDRLSNYFVNPDGKSILTIANPGIARLWSLTPSEPRGKLIKDSSQIVLSSISNNGQVVATMNETQVVRHWHAEGAGEIGKAFTVSKPGSNGVDNPYPDRARYFDDELIVSSQGRYSCIVKPSGQFTTWDVKHDREIPTDRSEKEFGSRLVSFSPNDEVLAIAGPSNVITLWKNLGGTPSPGVINSSCDVVDSLVFSPDGKYLAATCSSTSVKLFEVATGTAMKPLDVRLGPNPIALGLNGKLVVSIVSQDNAVLVWDPATDQSRRLSHKSTVTALTLNPDGTRALTSTSDGILQLWDTNSGKPIGDPEKYGTKIRIVRISTDGTTATAFSDNWIHVSSITETGLKYQDGRLIGPIFEGVPRVLDATGLEYQDGRMVGPIFQGVPRMLDATGRNFRRILEASQDSLEIEDINFFPQTSSQVPSKRAADLLNDWTTKLSLIIDARGQLTSEIVSKEDWFDFLSLNR